MTDLLAKLQSATGGSRDLDQAIWEFIGRPGDDDPRLYAFEHGDCPLHYTTNLQDAVSLVPEDWDYMVVSDDAASVFKRRDGVGGYKIIFSGDIRVRRRNEALALCIAIIKAHESKAEAA